MIESFPDANLLLAYVWLMLVILNSFLIRITVRYQKQQQLVFEAEGPSPGNLELRYFLVNALLGIFIYFWSSFLGDEWFQCFFGGFVTTQAIAITLSLKNISAWILMLDPSLVKGRLEFSQIYRYKRGARDLFGMSFLSMFLYLYSGGLNFLGATFFLIVTGIGYLRRVKQVK